MTTAKIKFGSVDKPGYATECDDSLQSIHETIVLGGWLQGYHLATVETDWCRLIIEKQPAGSEGPYILKPAQR